MVRKAVSFALAGTLLVSAAIVGAPAYAVKSKCMIEAEQYADQRAPRYSDAWYAYYDEYHEPCRIRSTQCNETTCDVPGEPG